MLRRNAACRCNGEAALSFARHLVEMTSKKSAQMCSQTLSLDKNGQNMTIILKFKKYLINLFEIYKYCCNFNFHYQKFKLFKNIKGALKMEERFGAGSLFKEMFSRHSEDELEAHWASGTLGNIPDIRAVDDTVPHPWGFFKILIFGIVAYLILLLGWRVFENQKLLPALIVLGGAVPPVVVTFLFFELNIRRNVSIYLVEKLLILGGIASIITALFLFIVSKAVGLDSALGASAAGVVEESAKLLTVVLVARRIRYPYILNGILFGVAVGAGFALIETAGFAMELMQEHVIGNTFTAVMDAMQKALMNNQTIAAVISNSKTTADVGEQLGNIIANDEVRKDLYEAVSVVISKAIPVIVDKGMVKLLTIRGLLAPLGHMVWTGIAAGALWRVARGRNWAWSFLTDFRFLGFFLVAMVLHGLWNAPIVIPVLGEWSKNVIIGVVGWSVLLYHVRLGLQQICEEKRKAFEDGSADDSAEAALASVLELQKSLASRLGTPIVPASSSDAAVQATPRRESDHLAIDDKVEESAERERTRTRPEFTNRSWGRYYGQGGQGVPSAPQGNVGQTDSGGRSAEPPAQSQGTGTAPKDAWRKY